ncbi:ankyrin repeat domain-containing protein [Endozoicomonas sp. ISHI1]|uniref:ankyrin repeat domain-containing protein n=2 Tax=unclassified Endozoicomonas TaxID=2644528 RepID=UPI0021492342|nr:ankyrin repeat domain-containing protein [Endozoicomonas sp. ISHI1]
MIKHSLYAAPLLLITLSVLCQAQPLTRRSVVAVEQKTGSQNLNFSIKPDQHTLSGTFSDIAHTKGYAESDLPPDEKQGRLNDCELKTIVIESILWPWLYANYKNTPLSSTSYSWLLAEVVVAVGWLLKSYWNIKLPSFNPITQKELCQVHPLAAIITMPGSGNDQQQHPPSESSGEQAQQATVGPAGSFNSFLYSDSDSADGSGGSQQHQHSLGLNCFVSPCHGVCQFRPSSDSGGPAEWPVNSAEHSTGQAGGTPEQSSCTHLDNGHSSECTGHVNSTDVLLMDGMAHPTVPTGTDIPLESDVCPICLVHFHGRGEALVVVKSQCCGHHFDLDCVSKCFVEQPIGSRQCAMCRQNPMPMLSENTGESHPDQFFPDQAFYNACFDEDLDQVQKSLAEGVNVNAVMNNDGLNALMLACIWGHKDVVEHLINAGADLNAQTEIGSTSLHFAARKGHSDIVKRLIEAGADINLTLSDGSTPLSIAAEMGHTDCVKTLIEGKANLNTRTKGGYTPLFIAGQENNTDCVKILIEAKADLNTRSNDGATALFIAAQQNNTDCLKILIEAGADINAALPNGVTPLSVAAAKGNTDSVEVLINTGADLNAQTESGNTALHIAARDGHADIVKRLIKAGADVNARDRDGITPLLRAVMKGNTECVEVLIYAGADLEIAMSDGTTSLEIAALIGNTNCLQLLTDAGANVNARARDGTTPLFKAVMKGNTECVKVLIDAGADLEAAMSDGTTPLDIAALMGNINSMQLLIDAGADVNARAKDGSTPLFVAVMKGNTERMKALINAGADVNAAMPNGTTPLLVATANGDTDSVEVLIDAGAK